MAAILLDTHALLWWLADDRRLPERARKRIADPDRVAMVSAVSAWEISIKQTMGKLKAPRDLLEAAEGSGLAWIPLDATEAYEAGRLPLHHRDPFDRLLLAQAMIRDATLISRDGIFDAYGARRLWQ